MVPRNPNMGLPVQFIHGMTSCSEWSGVLLSVLLNEAGVQKDATWLVKEGGDAGKFSHTLPLAKAMEDVIVAYGQNGEPLRIEQGYPIRLVVPGWEAPFSVKYLTHVKVVDKPYVAWNEGMNHSVARPDLGGKARWYHFQFGPKSVITRPSAGIEMRTGIYPDYRLGVVRCGRDHGRSKCPPTAAGFGRKRSFMGRCIRRRIPGLRSTGRGTDKKR